MFYLYSKFAQKLKYLSVLNMHHMSHIVEAGVFGPPPSLLDNYDRYFMNLVSKLFDDWRNLGDSLKITTAWLITTDTSK